MDFGDSIFILYDLLCIWAICGSFCMLWATHFNLVMWAELFCGRNRSLYWCFTRPRVQHRGGFIYVSGHEILKYSVFIKTLKIKIPVFSTFHSTKIDPRKNLFIPTDAADQGASF